MATTQAYSEEIVEKYLPHETRPIRMDPDVALAVAEELSRYEGDDLSLAQEAVLEVYQSGISGSFTTLVETYREKIREVVS